MIIPTDTDTDLPVAQKIAQRGSMFYRLTKVSEVRLEGYELSHDASGESKAKVYLAAHNKRPPRAPAIPKQKPTDNRIKVELLRASHLAKEMIEHASSAELIDLANAGFSLLDSLDELWKYRGARETDWGGSVNLLRAALTKVTFERLTVEQCERIVQFIDQCLASGNVDSSDQQLGIRLLRRANLDPWRVLSESA